jgi:hypothetical protein
MVALEKQENIPEEAINTESRQGGPKFHYSAKASVRAHHSIRLTKRMAAKRTVIPGIV